MLSLIWFAWINKRDKHYYYSFPLAETMNLKCGDYVLATKWSDGDPHDHWVVGFYTDMLGDRFNIVDIDGNLYRGNGFRRAKKISYERGAWILRNSYYLQWCGRSVWGWLRLKME